MDQIQAMRIFVRVVEAGTFTRAADSLGLPKGTVTKQIQALESRLHVKLLNRTTRRVTVTPDGAAYYERTARLLNDFDDIEASMTNAQANPTRAAAHRRGLVHGAAGHPAGAGRASATATPTSRSTWA